MSLWYKFLYQVGLTPWEEDSQDGMVAVQVAALLDREEKGREPPFGPVLDLGCGSGIWSIALAKRGWQVTGVDIVPKAIQTARDAAREADVEVRFVVGDVTALDPGEVGSDFRFVLDFECFNHLSDVQRKMVGKSVNAVTAPDATMLMLAWEPGRRWLLPPGANRDDLASAFPEWRVIAEDPYAAKSALPWWLRNTDIRFYRMRRSAQNTGQ